MNKKYQKPTVAIAHIIPANIIATSPTPKVGIDDSGDEVEAGGIDSKKRKDDQDNPWADGLW